MPQQIFFKSSIRLNKYIANTGLCSRRQADEYIAHGKVKVNGVLLRELGTKIDPTQANFQVTVNGRSITAQPTTYTYVMLNKPKGYTVTKSDTHAERTVMELLPTSFQHLNPVGRLDKNSEGLLLFTNDGELIDQLTHPRYEHDKEYIVRVREPLTKQDLKTLQQGMKLEEGYTGKHTITSIDQRTFAIVLHQGWKRQVRRMVQALGKHVVLLQRVRIGKLTLGKLPVGKWQIIQKHDV